MAAHPPAAGEARAAQDAAVAPPDDREAQGKAANAEKMHAAKAGEFDRAAFIAAVDRAVDAQAPKNLDEADKFSTSGKADRVRAEVDGKVTDGREASAKDIESTTKAPPDTSAAVEKPVTPLTPDRPPGDPGPPPAADAVPARQPAEVTDFSEGPAENDRAMADAEVTEEQLAKGNEPQFDEALSAKRTSEADSAKAPAQGLAAEDRQLSAAKAGAAGAGAQAMAGLTATRAAAGQEVDGGKGETRSKDEKKRAEVTAKLQKVFDGTKTDVESILSGLDKKVDAAFTSGEKAARDAFTADHKRRMKKYKDKRYSGLMGKARWVKDKLAGLPDEANSLYQEARKLYVSRMRTVISSVADIIGAELGRAKARIAQGRTELKAEVDRLPAELKAYGEEAAKDFAGKFDDLETTVNEKSEQLVQDLAQRYTAALNKIDEEITKLQEANKGLIGKAKDAIVGAIKTINELKNLLLGILAKAATAVMKILKDPIGFLGNLVRAVGAGLQLFITNIGDHLKTGLVSWLLGTAFRAGLDLPPRFDLRGIIHIIASLLGLTWDTIRARVTRKGVPDQAMTKVESSVPLAQSLAREGPSGAAKEIQAETGDLKSTILTKLTTYLVPTVLIAGITWILSLLNPASAFVRAVKAIIDITTFVVTQGAQLADFVHAVLDAVIAIANGGQAGVPKMIEAALAASVPLLIGFLAALLGIGGLANKVRSVFQAAARPVNRAIDKIVDFLAGKGRALGGRLKGKPRDEGATSAEKRQRLESALDAAVTSLNRYRGRPVARSFVAPILAAIRVRYGLRQLEPVPMGSLWGVRGKINPESEKRSQAQLDESGSNSTGRDNPKKRKVDEDYVKGISVHLPPYGKHLSERVSNRWWEGQLKATGAWESKDALGEFEIDAIDELGTDGTREDLKGFFVDGSNRSRRRLEGATSDSFRKYALHELRPSPKHSIRDGFYEKIGNKAKANLKENAKPEVKAGELAGKLNSLDFHTNEQFGRFSSLPVPERELDPQLKQAAGGRVVEFLKEMAEYGKSKEMAMERLVELWDEPGAGRNPHRAWLKDEFRGAGGLHEWIPTNQMIKMLDTGVRQKKEGLGTAVAWIELQDKLRSFTTDVIWDLRVTRNMTEIRSHDMDAHVGAFVNYDGNPIYNGRDQKWHKPLREYFDNFIKKNPMGTPLEYLAELRGLLQSGKLMWDGDVSNFSAEQCALPIRAIYKSIHIRGKITEEEQRIDPITVEDLSVFQKDSYARIEQDFLEAESSVKKILQAP
ncbi:HPC2 multi-domain protein [Streptomyces amakusaensis]|uniref:HPC2 multi-domain protein n=1 Tax=Streptomyces amakusaensis TaxID=67271 RepID=A0ABW0AE99_9ACTN